MKISSASLVFFASQALSVSNAFTVVPEYGIHRGSISTSKIVDHITIAAATMEPSTATEEGTEMDYDNIKNLPYRSLQKECKKRGLNAVGSTGALRQRLMENSGIVIYCKGDETDVEECVVS